MKKIFYLFAITAFIFTSCDPLEDVNEEVDALTEKDALVDDLILTLTDEDYETLELGFGNFSSNDDAKQALPGFLVAKYPLLGSTFLPNGEVDKSSTALITYKLFNKKNDEKSRIVYEATNQDYTDAGFRFPNTSSDEDVFTLLNSIYASPANRVLVSLTYTERVSGINTEVENGFIYSNGTWEKSIGITLDEYKAMGEARAQFSNEDEALVKIPVYLKNKLAFEAPTSGRIEGVMYKLYDSSDRVVKNYVVFFIYNGSNWVKYNNVIDQSIQLGHDGKVWVPDNTIKVALSTADIAFISNAFLTIYPGPADNLGFFKSFDVRASSANYWNDAMLLEAFNSLLNNLNPSAENLQKYSLDYVVYDGSTVTKTINLIKDGADYRLQTADD